MTIIRGATTVEADDAQEISGAVKEMLDEIFARNALRKEEVDGFLFSLTADLHSRHPAKAARECGYDFAPLFACTEPETEGRLARCIRVMLFTERPAGTRAAHVYLRGAKILRRDISEIYNIALDGPAGSGKSTVAERLAEDYHILHLDTGAMYRACALGALRKGIDPRDGGAVGEMLKDLRLEIRYEGGRQHTLLDGEDVSEAIRKNEVSAAASDISAHPAVREKMVEMQRKIASDMSCVLDGRDIGSVVLPGALFKFFLTADPRVRALRRQKELEARGEKVDFEVLLREIRARDKQDSEREISPLKRAEDAVSVDTSGLGIEEVVAKIKSLIQSKI